MYSNQVPSNDDAKLIKGMAYPFQPGPAGFPSPVSPENYVYHRIKALLDTGIGERVMHYDMGVNLMEYVFSNMTPIQKARLSSAVSNTIEKYIPGVIVQRVTVSEETRLNGDERKIIYDVSYVVGGQATDQQFVYDPGTSGE